MTAADSQAPRPKTPTPTLQTRAPRPPAVRLRRGVATIAGLGAAGLLAGALTWAFVVQPELRAQARDRKLDSQEAEARGRVRPSEVVTGQPATYGQLDRLPPPRRFGAAPNATSDAAANATPYAKTDASPQPSPSARSAAAGRPGRPGRSVATEARQADLFFAATAGGRAAAPDDGAAAGGDPSNGRAGPAARLGRDYDAVYNPHRLLDPLSPFELKAGAVIPAVLLTGIDTTRAGPVTASVTENTYDSVSGRHLVVPQGSRLVGRHEGESRHGDRRAFLVWERLTLPNGKTLVLTQAPGVDAQGTIGAPGQVDRRLLPLAIASLFAGAITTVGEIARDDDDPSGGFLGDAGDAASITAAQVGGRLIDRELEIRPSIRLRPGARLRVLITRDLVLEPYQP